MKSLFRALLVTIVTVIAFTSCGDDDKVVEGSNPDQATDCNIKESRTNDYLLINQTILELMSLETPPPPPVKAVLEKDLDDIKITVFINSPMFAVTPDNYFYEYVKYFEGDNIQTSLIDELTKETNSDRRFIVGKLHLENDLYSLLPYSSKEELKKHDEEHYILAFVKISRIAYNDDLDMACFYFSTTYNGNGAGYLVFCYKDEDKWKIESSNEVWTSD